MDEKRFETIEEAEKYIDDNINQIEATCDQIYRFCPLIRGTCRRACVCFVTAKACYVSEYSKGGSYIIQPPGCRNAMFWGFD